MKKSKLIIFIWLLFHFASCDSNRVFEQNTDLIGGKWAKEDTKRFEFVITDAKQPYDIYYNIRNSVSYPFHNLYLRYRLLDHEGNEISSALQNMMLFDEKSGKPMGDGLGDVFDLQVQMLDDYSFPNTGKYAFTIQQYMRKDTLTEILAVGVRIESSEP